MTSDQEWVESILTWWVKDREVTREQAAGAIVTEFSSRLELTEGLLREHIAKLEADLAAAQEQLAEMCQQMSYVRNCIEDQAMDAQFKSDLLWDIDQALSAAPAGGQVMWRGEAHHREFCTLHLPREADDALGQPDFDKVVDVTIRTVTEQGGE